MRYRLVDSHRNMSNKTRLAMADFFMKAKSLKKEDAMEQVDLCIWYEHEYAVKWFEIVVWDASKVVGFLRCLRYPNDASKWYIGDVNVLEGYRGRKIAATMYEQAIEEVCEYEAAQLLVTSVHRDNVNSIGLHKKMGFIDTGIKCDFPNLLFEEEETAYQKRLFNYFPVSKDELTVRSLCEIWIDYNYRVLNKVIDSAKAGEELYSLICGSENNEFKTIWCGNDLAGFTCINGDGVMYYNKYEIM